MKSIANSYFFFDIFYIDLDLPCYFSMIIIFRLLLIVFAKSFKFDNP